MQASLPTLEGTIVKAKRPVATRILSLVVVMCITLALTDTASSTEAYFQFKDFDSNTLAGAGVEAERQMSNEQAKRETMSIYEATVFNMWEIAAIIELQEQQGLCTKRAPHTSIDELRPKNPQARIPETAFLQPYLLTETEKKIIGDSLELLNKDGLTSHQSLNLLERLGRIIESGQRVAKGTMH